MEATDKRVTRRFYAEYSMIYERLSSAQGGLHGHSFLETLASDPGGPSRLGLQAQ
jgi:hypothetical protein